MHYRRIMCLLLGIWLGGLIVMAWYGASSFNAVKQVMTPPNPAFAVQTKPIGQAATRTVLHYAIAEQNQQMFQSWEHIQLLLTAFFLAYVLFGTLEGKFTLAMAMLLIVLTGIQRFAISPEMGDLGKALHYLPSDVIAGERAKFWLLHGTYLGCEALKLAVGALLLMTALRRSRSMDSVKKFDVIDKANHRRVNW